MNKDQRGFFGARLIIPSSLRVKKNPIVTPHAPAEPEQLAAATLIVNKERALARLEDDPKILFHGLS